MKLQKAQSTYQGVRRSLTNSWIDSAALATSLYKYNYIMLSGHALVESRENGTAFSLLGVTLGSTHKQTNQLKTERVSTFIFSMFTIIYHYTFQMFDSLHLLTP